MRNTKIHDEIGDFATIPHSILKMWPDLGIDAIALFVYLRYRTHRSRKIAFPAYKTITKDTMLNGHRIARAIRVLENFQILTKKKRFGRSTEYRLCIPRDYQNAQ